MSGEEIDVSRLGSTETNLRLKALRPGKDDNFHLINPDSSHFLAAGLEAQVSLTVEGSAGYYLGTCMEGPDISVEGNVGWYPGDNITGGRIVIRGRAGDGAGQGMYDGRVVVRGDCGSRTGQLMKGGTVIIGGNSGSMTGLYGFGGRIIVCGDVGEQAGESLIGGTLYVGGTIASLGQNALCRPVGDQEESMLEELLEEVGFSVKTEFRKIIPAGAHFGDGKEIGDKDV